MKPYRTIAAATFAAVVIGALTMSPASAAVKNEISHFGTNDDVFKLERDNLRIEGDFEFNDKSYGVGGMSAGGDSQALNKRRSKGKSEDRQG